MFKKLLSSALCIALLATAVPTIGMTASADETKDYGLAEKTSQGVILHAFNWSYNTIKDHLPEIAEAGYTTVQTSPVQTPKDFGGSMDTAISVADMFAETIRRCINNESISSQYII